MKRPFTALKNLLFPARCIVCGEIIKAQREELCPGCRKTLPWAGDGLRPGGYHEGAASTLRYEGGVRDAFLRYKFSGQYWLAEPFAELLAETVSTQLSGRFDLITWVPVSKKRLRARTYDQSRLLAEAVSKILEAPVLPGLQKTKNTRANSSLADERERVKNVEGAYEALPGIEGRRVLLVDDVLTTGSTLSECAKTLLLGGAESVICATLIRAGD